MQTQMQREREREGASVAWSRQNWATGIYTIRVRESDIIHYAEGKWEVGKGRTKVEKSEVLPVTSRGIVCEKGSSNQIENSD